MQLLLNLVCHKVAKLYVFMDYRHTRFYVSYLQSGEFEDSNPMDMIDEELNRLKTRVDELKSRIMPDLESKAEVLYARIMPMKEGSKEREKLEAEYTLLSKELSRRSNELINHRSSMDNLEFEKSLKR